MLAFTFGYGRFLLNAGYFEQDFGLKTALNTLNHQSLRSVELHTLEDQPIQKKSQATRGSEASVFGILITHDPQPASRADMASEGLPRLHAPIQPTCS